MRISGHRHRSGHLQRCPRDVLRDVLEMVGEKSSSWCFWMAVPILVPIGHSRAARHLFFTPVSRKSLHGNSEEASPLGYHSCSSSSGLSLLFFHERYWISSQPLVIGWRLSSSSGDLNSMNRCIASQYLRWKNSSQKASNVYNNYYHTQKHYVTCILSFNIFPY